MRCLVEVVYADDHLVRPRFLADLPVVVDGAADHHVLIAESAGVLGVVAVAPHGSSYAEITCAGEWELRMLAVAAAARGCGVGQRLVSEAVSTARQLGGVRLVLSTRPSEERAAARRLYVRAGFSRLPERDLLRGAHRALIAYAVELS